MYEQLLDEAVALAQSENAAMILCTGDLFDTPAPYRDTVEAAVAAFRRADDRHRFRRNLTGFDTGGLPGIGIDVDQQCHDKNKNTAADTGDVT